MVKVTTMLCHTGGAVVVYDHWTRQASSGSVSTGKGMTSDLTGVADCPL